MKKYLIKASVIGLCLTPFITMPCNLYAQSFDSIVKSRYGGRLTSEEVKLLGTLSPKFDAIKSIVKEKGDATHPLNGDAIVDHKDPEAPIITAQEFLDIQKKNPNLTLEDYGRVAEAGLKPAKLLTHGENIDSIVLDHTMGELNQDKTIGNQIAHGTKSDADIQKIWGDTGDKIRQMARADWDEYLNSIGAEDPETIAVNDTSSIPSKYRLTLSEYQKLKKLIDPVSDNHIEAYRTILDHKLCTKFNRGLGTPTDRSNYIEKIAALSKSPTDKDISEAEALLK